MMRSRLRQSLPIFFLKNKKNMKIEQKKYTLKTGWETVSDQHLEDKAQLVFVFGARNLLENEKRYKEVKKFYPRAHVLSASTAGEILGTTVSDNSIVVSALFFENTKLEFAQVPIKSMNDSFKVGQKLASKLDTKDLVHTLVISDGLNVNGSELVKGLISQLPKNVAVTGGFAGDGSNFKETLVGLNAAPKSKGVNLIGFYGKKLKVGYGSMGGWDPFGPERLITRSEGSVLYTLDNKPALQLYKEYLGDQAKDLPASGLLFPLCIRSEPGKNDVVRTILAVDEKNQTLTFAGDVPEGYHAHLMRGNFDHLIDGSSAAAAMAHASLGSAKPDFALLISCVGRKLVLKQRIDEEVEVVKAKLGGQVTMAGFYSYGEICPFASANKNSEFHNQTMTITTFAEK
jgi:hypothetical protein